MMSSAYDDGNPFARILRGELPAQKVYEDEHSLVIMDIMPRSDGHCLALPKRPCRNLLDAEPDTLAHLIHAVQKVSQAAMRAFDADGITIDQFNEPAAGQTVFHLHFHIMPRFEGVALRRHTGAMADPGLLGEQAQKLRDALKTAEI